MKSKSELKTKREVKRKMSAWIITFIIVAILGTGGVIGWSCLMKEQNEGRSLPLNAVDFSKLNDGIYIGEYDGGMYKWRANKVQVTVTSGKAAEIKLLKSTETRPPEFINELFNSVINAQSLQVDTISGATITSKSYLQSVENALKQAQK